MATIQFFPYDATYKMVSGKAHILLYGRTMEGQRIIVVDEDFEPYFYATAKPNADLGDVEQKLQNIRIEENGEVDRVVRVEKVEKNKTGKGVQAFKIVANLPRAVPKIRDIIKSWDALEETYEYDILFARRYLIDKKLLPMSLCEVQGEFISIKSRVQSFKASSIIQVSKEAIKPKILAIDIETYMPSNMAVDFDKNPILMAAIYGEGIKKVFVWRSFETALDYVEIVKDEAELLEKLRQAILDYGPDIISGYYSDGFDMPYIRARAEKYRIKLDIGPDFAEPKMRGKDDSEFQVAGMVHLDIFKFIRKVMRGSLDADGYSLDSVANHILGESKHKVDLDALSGIWDNNPSQLGAFCEYNLHDAYLAHKLTLKMMPTMVALVQITGLTPFEVCRMGFSQLVEWFLLKLAPEFNEIAPNKPREGEISRRYALSIEGGFVFEPKPGLYHDIAVFDYLSLYPTVIASHNIGPESLRCECCKGTAKRVPGEDDLWFCTKKTAFLPTVIQNIIETRVKMKIAAKKASGEEAILLDAQQGALKLLANSFYGYLGFSVARWYSLESAKATTAYGRYYVHQVIDKAQQKGFTVLYADTDSAFLSLKGKTKHDAREFVEEINDHLPGLMELEFDGFYPSGIFVSAKMTGYGAKKKYALLGENGKLKIRGFETVRRNWAEVAKDTQEKVLDIVLRENNPKKALEFVKQVIKELREKAIPLEKVIIKMQLVKELGDYMNRGPHVAAAELMKKRGISVASGTIISYVVTQGKDIIRNRVKLPDEVKGNEYDPEYYIENQVVPAVDRIFDVLGYSKDELLGSHKQQTLSGFFS